MAIIDIGTATAQGNTEWEGKRKPSLFDVSGKRWNWVGIDESLWSSSFPFQLAVLEAQGGGKYTQKETFTLPINPESLVNAMPFATVLQATFGGVIENNGGVPFRSITLTGNLGVINERDSAEGLGGVLSAIGGIAGGTIQAGLNLLTSATILATGDSFTDNLYPPAVVGLTSGLPASATNSTGYYQWLFLQRFLESYAEAKKTEDGTSLRLALYIWKEKAAYLISPEILQLTRSADKPMEYQYTFRCTAFSRLNPDLDIFTSFGKGFPLGSVTSAGSKSKTTQTSTFIQHARAVLKATKNLIVAVKQDYEQFEGSSLRSVGLLLKDVVGVRKTWEDFPDSIKNAAKKEIDENKPLITASAKAIAGTPRARSTVSRSFSITADTSSIDELPIDQLGNPSEALSTAVSKEIARVRALTSNDFRNIRKQIEDLNTLFSSKVRLPDPRATNTVPTIRQATDDDIRAIMALSESTDAISQMIVIQNRQPETSLLDYVAGLATAAGIDMRRAESKFAVPFPYGYSLEKLAFQYLGDASRWGEIAALNELREPYIDEVGEAQSLMANGKDNNIFVSDGTKLQIDHLVSIASNTQFSESRRVLSIRELAPGYWSITLSGPEDLSKYKIDDAATIRYFLPGTVNSGKVIFIPSESPTSNTDLAFRFVPTLSDLERILQAGGVDGRLTDSLDIAITQDGDWSYTQGLETLIQWARVALNTPLGSWLLYPSFGIDVQVGQSLADVSAEDILASVKNSFALNSAFTGVNSALVNINGPVTEVTLELGVAGSDTTLPITFQLPQ